MSEAQSIKTHAELLVAVESLRRYLEERGVDDIPPRSDATTSEEELRYRLAVLQRRAQAESFRAHLNDTRAHINAGLGVVIKKLEEYKNQPQGAHKQQ